MTSPSPAIDSPAADQQACQRAAAELRRQHPRWVVIWLASSGLFCGYPLFTSRLVRLTAAQPAELAAQMDHAEQAARPPRARRPRSAA